MKKQNFNRFRDVTLIQPERATLEIPIFTLAIPSWTGASLILAEYPVGNDYYFSFRVPISPFGANFIPAVRWAVDDVAFRYKFYDHDDAVLYYPVYTGERIGLSAVIEIWSVNSVSAPALTAAEQLEISVMAFQSENNCQCVTSPSSNTILTARASTITAVGANGNPFSEILEVP